MAIDRYGDTGRIKILLDANALMMPVQFGIDIYAELTSLFGIYECLVPEGVMNELQGIAEGGGRDAAAARVGMELAKRSTIISTGLHPGSVDDRLVAYAEAGGCIVVTNDRHLRNTLLERGIGVVSMRKQQKLELIRG